MTIPRLSGWWDELNQGGAAEKFVGALDRRIRPDAYAQQALQKMIQENPAVLEQLANMDDGQRALFQQTMGFRNQAPLQNLAPGFERQKQQEFLGALERTRADPLLSEMRDAVITGTGAKTDIVNRRRAQDQEFKVGEFDLASAVKDRKLKDLLNGQQERIVNQLEGYRQKYPELDVNGILRGIQSGNMTQPLMEQLQVLQSENPGLIDMMMGVYEMNTRFNQSLRLRSQDDSAGLARVAVQAASLAQREYNAAVAARTNFLRTNKIASANMERAFAANPQFRAEYDELNNRIESAKAEYNNWVPYTKGMFGVQDQNPFKPLSEVDPAIIEQYKNAIASQPQKAAEIRALFKSKYKEDLP